MADMVSIPSAELKKLRQRAEAEAQAREAARYTRAVIEASLDAIAIISVDGKITDVNQAAEQALGISRDHLIGSDFAVPFTDPEMARAGFRKVLEEGLARDFPLTLRSSSGETMDVLFNATVYRGEEGDVQGVLTIARNVTEWRKAQSQAARLAAIVTSSQDAIFTKDLDDIVTSWNAAAEALYGYSAAEMIGTKIEILAPADRADEPRRLVERVRRGERITGFETRRKRKDGTLLDVSLNMSPIRDDAGNIAEISVIGHDITARKHAEEERQESERSKSELLDKLNAAQSIAAIGSWDWDLRTDHVWWSDETYRIFGASPEEFVPSFEANARFIHPDDVAGYNAAFSHSVETGKPLDHDYRVVTGDGRLKYCTSKGEVTCDESGQPARFVGTVLDITQRHQAEEERLAHLRLVESMDRVNRAIQRTDDLEQMMNGVLDEVLHILDADRAWLFYACDPTATTFRVPMEVAKPEYPGAGILNDDVPLPPDMAENLREALESPAPVTYVAGSDRPVNKVSAEQFGVQSMMITALYPKSGKPWAFGLHQCSYPRVWTQEDRDLFQEAGRRLADALTSLLAYRELQDSEARYRRIVDTAREGVWVFGPDSTTTFVNARTAEILGYSEAEMAGRRLPDFMLDEEDRLAHQRKMEDRQQGLSEDYELRLRRKDGRVVWVLVSAVPVFDGGHNFEGTFGMLTDITDRKQAEETLRASQRKLALHLEQTLLGVIEFDTDFCVREWNPAAEAMFGYSREEAIGRRADELLVSSTTRSEIVDLFGHVLRQDGGEFSTNENITKDGRTILCEWVNTPLVDDSGTVIGVMSLARDITEQRQAEQLRVAKKAAEGASAAKSAFLANMSHEIRTPMNAILGFSQLMRHDRGLSDRQRQQLDIINSSGEHLLALINDVLEMSKIEAGRVSANLTAFDLYALLDEMDSLFSQRAEAKGLELSVVRADDVPRFIVTDENKLRQVLVNLLGNAVKFTDEGNVTLRVGVWRHEQGGLRLSAEVEDTGRGIAPEDSGRLFEYFEQATVSREAEAGTGLGLAISREFVRLLGGEITAESQVGVGSTFKFDIVIEEAEAKAAPVSLRESHVVGLYPGQPRYRVLVADDAPDNRELLVEMLEPVGFTVRSVANGKEALEHFMQWHPQLILMDMRMPVMDGYEATRRIRSAPGGADVAIIGVTASAFAEMRQGVFDAGVDEFIVKPFHEGELFDKMGALLGVRYVYEEHAERTDEGVSDALDQEAMAALPSDLLIRLRRSALSADFDAILDLADEIAPIDERSAATLRILAERFDSDSILSALPRGADQ